METNWNQLIERYLQNELSEEGKLAFEQELQLNPELREELEMHELIQSAAKRASQRTLVQQVGKSYLRNLRIKQVALGVIVTTAVTVGVIYWAQHKKQSDTDKPKQEFVTANLRETEEPIVPEDTLNVGLNPLTEAVPPPRVQDRMELNAEKARSAVSFSLSKKELVSKEFTPRLKTIPVTFRQDTVALEISPAPVSGSKTSEPKGLVLEEKYAEWEWRMAYDSVGRFNDLYCGYALVMHHAKIGFVDPKGNLFIPLIYDQIVVTSNIQSSKDKHKKKRKVKVLYIPKRSGSEVQYCDEKADTRPVSDSVR